MGRHAAFDELVGNEPEATGRGRGARPRLVAALIVLFLVVAVGTTVFLVGPRKLLDRLPVAAVQPCTGTEVRVVATPAAAPTVTQILAAYRTADEQNGCVRATVETQESVETVAGSTVLPLDRAPDLWLPDSSLWAARAPRWPASKVGSLGISPLVIATSRKVIAQRWPGKPPAWVQALTSGQPLALPSAAEHAESLVSLTAMWKSLGGGRPADQAVIGVQLVAARTADLSPQEALGLAQEDSPTAPLVPATEQSVFAANRELSGSGLTALYPADGSPALDYPLLRLKPAGVQRSVEQTEAVDAVVARLLSPEAISLATSNGFRQSARSGPKGVGVSAGAVGLLPAPAAADLRTVLLRIATLAKPTRLLGLIDVSLSMSAQLPDGTPRIKLAAAAAAQGIQLLPDSSSAGIWVFSTGIDGDRDFLELAPADPLGTVVPGGGSHREQVVKAIGSSVRRLRPGGTPLYDSVLAAVRALRTDYDAKSVNSVVVFTDGANANSRGISLNTLLRTLEKEADPKEPVAVYAIGIGPDVDLSALKDIAKATKGRAYQVDSPAEIRNALLDGLSTRLQADQTG